MVSITFNGSGEGVYVRVDVCHYDQCKEKIFHAQSIFKDIHRNCLEIFKGVPCSVKEKVERMMSDNITYSEENK